jgi:hypothetical protein
MHNYPNNQRGNKEENDHTLNSKGTPSNPILLDEDEDIQMDQLLGQAQEHGLKD